MRQLSVRLSNTYNILQYHGRSPINSWDFRSTFQATKSSVATSTRTLSSVRLIESWRACRSIWPYTGITEQAGTERCDGNGCCIISLDGGGAQEPQASAFNLSLGAEEADNQVMTEAPCFGTKLRLQARMLPSSGVLWMNQVAPAH